MTCQHIAQLEAYLDGELSREDRKEFAKHLDHCTVCRHAMTEHKRLAAWADEVIAESFPVVPEPIIDALDINAAWSRFQDRLAARATSRQAEETPEHFWTKSESAALPQEASSTHTIKARSWSQMAKTYQKWIAGTIAAGVVIGALTIPQVQAAADDLLSMFRADKFQAIRITEQELTDMQNWVSSGAPGERELSGLGKITMPAPRQAPRTFDNLELAKNEGYVPAAAPKGFKTHSLTVSSEFTMQLTLNTEKTNNMLKSLGSNLRFDEALNNNPFQVVFPRITETRYESTDIDGLDMVYSVMKTPHMEAPSGVDLDQLRLTVLQLPFLPRNVARQLAQIEDWKNTVPVPYVEGGNMETVTLGGGEAIFTGGQDHNGATLIWQKDGQLHRLQTISKSDNTKPIPDLKSYLIELAKTFN